MPNLYHEFYTTTPPRLFQEVHLLLASISLKSAAVSCGKFILSACAAAVRTVVCWCKRFNLHK